MDSIECRCKILIADGGNDENLQNHLESNGHYRNLDYTYIRYPYDKSLEKYYRKLCDVTDKVYTPYVMYADNDDFIIIDNINDYIGFLENNSDYGSCGGDSAALTIYSKSDAIVNACYGQFFNIRRDKSVPSSNELNTGISRVCRFLERGNFDKTWFVWYDIQRVDLVRLSHEYIKKYDFKDVVSFEMYRNLSLLLLGKSKKFDSLFYVRQSGTSETSSDPDVANNIVERFIRIDAFGEIMNGLVHVDKTMRDDEKIAINRAFARWISDRAAYIYFSRVSTPRILINKIQFFLGNFVLMNLIIQLLYSLRNLLSPKKVEFLRISSIERAVSNKFE